MDMNGTCDCVPTCQADREIFKDSLASRSARSGLPSSGRPLWCNRPNKLGMMGLLGEFFFGGRQNSKPEKGETAKGGRDPLLEKIRKWEKMRKMKKMKKMRKKIDT